MLSAHELQLYRRWTRCRMARFLVMCLFAAAWSGAALADAAAEKFIDSEIDRLVALYSDGIAVGYPEYRHVKFARLPGSGGEAAVVLFSVEGFQGGNLHEEYLAVFEPVEAAEIDGRRTNPYRLLAVQKIGGRGWRTFDPDTMRIAAGTITLKGSKWQDSDPGCCASTPIAVGFRLRDDALVETRK